MATASTHEMDLTKGNLFWKIPLFALPLALTTFLQLFYTTVDLWTVSNFGGGSLSMSAVGSNGALINLIVTVFVSLSLGANVAIGNAKGANQKEHAEKVLHTSLIVAVFTGIGVGVFGALMSRYFLQWMQTNDNIIDLATQYLAIYFLGMPFLMVYNYCSQIMRALGDSRRPLYILFFAGIVNIAADFVLVYYFHLDVAGVAWATVLSEAISALLSFLALRYNKNGYIAFSWKKCRIDKESFNEIMRIGLPAGFQGLAFSIPNVLIQSSLYSIKNDPISSNDIVTGSAASGNIEGYIYALVDAVASACVAFIGQNYGAKNKKNCRKVFWFCHAWMLIFWSMAAVVTLVWGHELLRIFINGSDGTTNIEDATTAGYQRLWVLAVFYFLDGIMDVDSGYLRGMRYSVAPAVITLMGCTVTRIIFLIALFPLSYFHNVSWLYAVFPISWTITDISYGIAILFIEPRAFKKIEEPHVASETLVLKKRSEDSGGGRK